LIHEWHVLVPHLLKLIVAHHEDTYDHVILPVDRSIFSKSISFKLIITKDCRKSNKKVFEVNCYHFSLKKLLKKPYKNAVKKNP
jgi:hypothetical protein